MAFPSDSGSKPDTLEAAFRGIRGSASAIKRASVSIRDASLAGDIGSTRILDYVTLLAEQRLLLTRFAQVPGLAAYAQAQVNDPTLNVATEYTAMTTALDATINWVRTNFPASGGYLLARQFTEQGRTTDRVFSTASLAAFRTQIAALIATID